MKAVKAGEEVILTERGKPIAVIKPLKKSEKGETMIRRLETAGLLRAAARTQPLPSWNPRRLRSAPLSKTIREEKDSF